MSALIQIALVISFATAMAGALILKVLYLAREPHPNPIKELDRQDRRCMLIVTGWLLVAIGCALVALVLWGG